jgi:hypothetical protein
MFSSILAHGRRQAHAADPRDLADALAFALRLQGVESASA